MTTLNLIKPDGNQVKLTDKHFLAAGGEGSVYRQGPRVYKVYLDSSKNYDWLQEKVALLSPLLKDNDHIIAPSNVVRNPAGKIVGYEMPYQEGTSLSAAFTNAWWTANGYDFSKALNTVCSMRDLVATAHKHKALLVDGNEMNYLINQDQPYVIDVDSWQVGKFKATAIMPSIADPHRKDFDEGTDWFAWAIVTFQLWTGLHPFRGAHPKYKRADLLGRMTDNVSVFDPQVTYPSSVRSFSNIPPVLLNWYRTIFDKGERSTPPDSSRKFQELVAKPTPTTLVHRAVHSTGGGSLTFNKIFEAEQPILRPLQGGLVMLVNGLYRWENKTLQPYLPFSGIADKYSVITDATTGKILVFHPIDSSSTIRLTTLERDGKLKKDSVIMLSATSHYSSGNRVFAVQERGVSELQYIFTGSSVTVGVKKEWPVLTNSFLPDNRSGAGVFFAVGGVAFLVLPVDNKGCFVCPLPQLNGKKLVQVWGRNPFVTCTTLERDGTYMKHEFFLDSSGAVSQYWQAPVDSGDINVAVTPKGVVVTVSQDDELVLFSAASQSVRKVSDSRIKLGNPLYNVDGKMLIVEGSSLWDVSLT